MRVLKAEKGCYLTNKDNSKMGSVLYLPDENTDVFHSITEDEHKQMLLAQQEQKRVAVINRLTHKIHSL